VDEDCSGDEGGINDRCLNEANFGASPDGGYCTKAFCSQFNIESCPEGSHCAALITFGAFPTCLEDCDTDSDCRDDGYVCADEDEDGEKECVIGGTGDGVVGDMCSSNGACAGGVFGYCDPDVGCALKCGVLWDGVDMCPADTVCSQFRCVKTCATSAECRAGQNCIDDFENPGSKVCR